MSKEKTISIIIPTYNESDNVGDILKSTIEVLKNINVDYEILIVDDASVDNTAEIAEKILGDSGRVIRRVSEKKSLSLSVLDGIKQARGSAIVVMDADGSHPPELIPSFIHYLEEGYDLIIGSRYVKGGGTKGFPLKRKFISGFACFLGRVVTKVKDNTSGFFCIKKAALEGINLTPHGFKIGLEIFVKANFTSFKEIPYIFVDRIKGESKLKSRVVAQYLCQILNLLTYRIFRDR
jgi:dolichol-phosphate mannosyltransferase